VWAAGVKAPDFLKDLGGLETNRINQLVVLDTLQTTRDKNIFALGDCAACPCPDEEGGRGGIVPPRAQAAHQQASHLFQQIKRRLSNKTLRAYRYRDFGSLVSLGKFSTVGNMMGGLIGKNFMIEGYFAKLMYLSLYKLHELAIHGVLKTSLYTFARMITKQTNPAVKLH
jgi:NADH dehydrogenase